jgi:hypothetical protein
MKKSNRGDGFDQSKLCHKWKYHHETILFNYCMLNLKKSEKYFLSKFTFWDYSEWWVLKRYSIQYKSSCSHVLSFLFYRQMKLITTPWLVHVKFHHASELSEELIKTHKGHHHQNFWFSQRWGPIFTFSTSLLVLQVLLISEPHFWTSGLEYKDMKT